MPQMTEIVAAKIGSFITANPMTIVTAIEAGVHIELIDRPMAQRMARIFEGRWEPSRWERLAASPTLLLEDEAGNFHLPKKA